MKIHRFIGKFIFEDEKAVIEDKDIVNQIKNVLKLRAGEQIILGDGDSNEVLVELSTPRGSNVEGRVLKKYKNKNEAEVYGILYCAILKRENFEIVVQKATEIGISEIIPLITERTVKLNLNYDRLEKIIKEAAEQSGRGKIPILQKVVKFEEAIEKVNKNDLNVFLDSSGKFFSVSQREVRVGQRRSIWVGPEGGWSDNEINYFLSLLARPKLSEGGSKEKENFKIVSLGKTTLRAETAAIVGSYLLLR